MKIRPIGGRDGYFVSDEGHVFSKWVNKGMHGLVKENELKELKGSRTKTGHLYITFGRKNGGEYIHRIVYESFEGPIKDGYLIRHLNDDPSDNRLVNLAQGTQKENMEDALKNNKLKVGSENPSRKLNEKEVLEIMDLAKVMPHKEIASLYNVGRRTIDKIIKKETWRHVS